MVTHISRATGQFEVLSAVTARTVSPLNERRAAVIAAAVSGQIPVPEVSV